MTNNDKTAEELAKSMVLEINRAAKIGKRPEKVTGALVEMSREALATARESGRAEGYRQGAESKWLPIDSAPRDGTRVMLFHPRYGAGSGHFDGIWHMHFCINKEATPTKWQPLPPAPKGEE